jgi:glutathione synthase/RimK-type ligase-like ATP-grasp enzyme
MPLMQAYDLCLPWYWIYDHDFVQFMEAACACHAVTIWQITPTNILQAVNDVFSGNVSFNTLLDRAADDLRFEPFRRFALEHGVHRLNPPEYSHWSEDKATMHLELIQAGVQTPYTTILAPYIVQPVLPALNLAPFGARFVLKPAVGGGGEGVKMNASTMEDVQRARLEFPDQKYLVQEQVDARVLHGQDAWFRIFYVGGDCIPCWWHPVTHVYAVLNQQEEAEFNLTPLHSITATIARVCKLDWFSTEIALTSDGRFVAVDYVNDGIDTRIQSKAADGVPDDVMRRMTDRLASLVVPEIKASH